MKNKQLDHQAYKAGSTKFPLCLLANDIDVPMNVGSFFRIADALGVARVGRESGAHPAFRVTPHTYRLDTKRGYNASQICEIHTRTDI